jgi:N-acetylglutamate synthase-like GNAT family acetyltransferase
MARAMALSDQTWVIEPGLTIAELPAAEALVAEAGWNQVAADWRAFLDFGTVHAVRTDAGQVIATAATLPYGDRICWISMVLVAGRYRRRGLATSLLRRCLDDIAAAGLTAVLDATAAGQPVYRALDFVDLWSFTRLAAPARSQIVGGPFSDEIVIRSIDDSAWPALCAYDAAAFGADRSAVLGRMRGRLPPAELLAERRGRLVGLLVGRDGRTAAQLGPLIAEDDAVAEALLARALRGIESAVIVDLADTKPRVRAWLEASGFSAQRGFMRMCHGRPEGLDDQARTAAVMGPEFG